VKPDELDRREVVKVLAAVPLVPLAALGTAAYAPKFFSSGELELVATLGELILPQTETPGARAARAHEHIDLVLSEEIPEVRRAFRDGLAWIERQSRESHDRAFAALTPEQQNAMLARMSSSPEGDAERRFFRELRKRVVFAYYTSEIGLRQELEYKGKQMVAHWPGCPHDGRHGDSE
jgi:gluconate 2-dehydrogenase gamma chain